MFKQDESCPDIDLSNYQRAEVVVHALTLFHLYKYLNAGADRNTALEYAAEVGMVCTATVRAWERAFMVRGHIKISAVGRFERSFLGECDEDVTAKCKGWVRENTGILPGEPNKTAADFMQFCNKEIMPMIEKLGELGGEDYNPFKGLRVKLVVLEKGQPARRQISLSTATAWLKKLGCEYHSGKGGLYFDGHDNEEVMRMRNEEYLPEYFEHREYMEVWLQMPPPEAGRWGIDIANVPEGDRADNGDIWVCVEDLQPLLCELPPELRARVTSKRRYSDGKQALQLLQDESCFKGIFPDIAVLKLSLNLQIQVIYGSLPIDLFICDR